MVAETPLCLSCIPTRFSDLGERYSFSDYISSWIRATATCQAKPRSEETNLVEAWPTHEQIERFGEKRAWTNFGNSIELSNRNLDGGNFALSTFDHADLRLSRLQGADFEGVSIRGG
jgi:uncharacterized protein YjbI with pentapeptide repeats